MLRHLAAVITGASVLLACTDAAVNRAEPPPEEPARVETPDATSRDDVVVETLADAAATEAGPNGGAGCPPPAKLGPTDVPVGFMKPVTVTIASLADGDSGRYNFPTVQGQGVRMLFIDTEESIGVEKTQFGVTTKGIIHKWIRDAATIQIAVREDFAGSNTPDIDPYDRWLSIVFLDGELLQTRIIREGLSAYYTQFGCASAPFHEPFLHAEAEANAADRGIWGPGPHNDYQVVIAKWIGNKKCRPNPYLAPYCN